MRSLSKYRVNEPFVMAAGGRERGSGEMDGEVVGCGHNLYFSVFFQTDSF